VNAIKIGEIYYFDGFHHGQHLYNGLITPLQKQRYSYKSKALQIDVLGKKIKIMVIDSDVRFDKDKRDYLFELSELTKEIKRILITQILSFKIGNQWV
jgi:hypothetical protein